MENEPGTGDVVTDLLSQAEAIPGFVAAVEALSAERHNPHEIVKRLLFKRMIPSVPPAAVAQLPGTVEAMVRAVQEAKAIPPATDPSFLAWVSRRADAQSSKGAPAPLGAAPARQAETGRPAVSEDQPVQSPPSRVPTVLTEIGPYLVEIADRVANARTMESLGHYGDLYAREPKAADQLDRFDRSVRALEDAEVARLTKLEAVFELANSLKNETAELRRTNGWGADTAAEELPKQPTYTALVEAHRIAARELAIASNQVSAAMRNCDREAYLFAAIEKGASFSEAHEQLVDHEAKMAALDAAAPRPPSEPPPPPSEPETPATAPMSDDDQFDICLNADVIGRPITRWEARNLPDENLEGLLLSNGVPENLLASTLASLRAKANLPLPDPTTEPAPSSTPVPPGPADPSAPAPAADPTEVQVRVRPLFYKNAARVTAIDGEATKLTADYAQSLVGENVANKALQALDELGPAFFEKLSQVSTQAAIDQMLTNRREVLLGVTHPFNRPPAHRDHFEGLMGIKSSPVPTELEWLLGRPGNDALSEHSEEIREVARLTTMVQCARDGGVLKDARGFDDENVRAFSQDRLALGPFRSEDAMREFGRSCRDTESYVREHAMDVGDRQRRALASAYGTMPAALARAATLLDATINPSRLSRDQIDRMDGELAMLLGKEMGTNLETTLGDSQDRDKPGSGVAPGRKAHALFDVVRNLVGSDVHWRAFEAHVQDLAGASKAAYFRKATNPLQDSDQTNAYSEPAEIEAQKILGPEFQTAYSRMSGEERHQLWQSIARQMARGRTLGGSMGVFLAVSSSVYREDREIAAEVITKDVHTKLHGLRSNAISAEERVKARDDHARSQVEKGRKRGGDIVDRATGHAGGAAKSISDQISQHKGFDVQL